MTCVGAQMSETEEGHKTGESSACRDTKLSRLGNAATRVSRRKVTHIPAQQISLFMPALGESSTWTHMTNPTTIPEGYDFNFSTSTGVMEIETDKGFCVVHVAIF